jgi:hypothetical protein
MLTGSARNLSPHAAQTCRSTCVSSASSSPSNHSRYFFLFYVRLTYLNLSGSLSLFAKHFIGSRIFSRDFSRHLHVCKSPLMVQWLNTCLPRRRPEFDSRMVQKIFSHCLIRYPAMTLLGAQVRFWKRASYLCLVMGGRGVGAQRPFCVLVSLKIRVRAARSKPACKL